MSWLRQVLHVTGKDVRMAAGPLLLYAVVLLATTASSVLGRPIGLGSTGWTMLLVVVGMAVVAVIIQGDSPARLDAFWVTRPLAPSAVFAAKLLGIVAFLLVPGLLAQAAALAAHAVPAGDYSPQLAASALAFWLWLAGAGAIAALTRDLRGFVVALVSLLVSFVLLTTLLFSRSLAPQPTMVADEAAVGVVLVPYSAGLLPVLLLVLIGIVAHQYLTRRVRRGVLLLGAAILLLSAAGSLGAGARAQEPRTLGAPEELRPRLTEARLQLPAQGGSWPHVELVLTDVSPRHRYTLGPGSLAVVKGDDGGRADSVALRVISPYGLPVPETDSVRLMAAVFLGEGHTEALRTGQARLIVHGRIDVAEPRELGSLPLTDASTIAARGYRIRLVGWRSVPPGRALDIVATFAGRRRGPGTRVMAWQDASPLTFTLMGPDAAAAVTLAPSGSSTGMIGLVLPGADLDGGLLTFREQPDWPPLANARLVVSTWESLGTYPVEVAPTADSGRR